MRSTGLRQQALCFATGPYDIGYGMRPYADKYAFAAEKDTRPRSWRSRLDKYEAIAQRKTRKRGGSSRRTAPRPASTG